MPTTYAPASQLLAHARAGDTATIRTSHGQERSGRVVIRGPHGLVLNLGGRYGTPGVATEANIVSVRKARAPRHSKE